MLHSGELTAIAVVFWVFLAIVSIAGMFQDYRKRKLALEPLRIAIEQGQQLTPEIIATLLGREDRDRERAQTLDPKLLEVGGIITCAAGVGVALLSLSKRSSRPRRLLAGCDGWQSTRCITLAYAERMSHREICAATGLPLGTVKSHITRGAARLRGLLGAYA